jgi:hypothetical protein
MVSQLRDKLLLAIVVDVRRFCCLISADKIFKWGLPKPNRRQRRWSFPSERPQRLPTLAAFPAVVASSCAARECS